MYSRSMAAALLMSAASFAAADNWRGGYSIYGTNGVIEMPSAFGRPDAEIGATIGGFENQQRISFTFQITPRLSGTFRYSRLDEWSGPGADPLFDRSFDIHYQLLEETERLPALAIGLRDFMGTGVYTGEYVVAGKTITPNLRLSAGLGWGRLASNGGFENPLAFISEGLAERPPLDFGFGGEPSLDQFFRGDAALFGGVEWRFTDSLVAKAEYSSDAYTREVDRGVLNRDTPFNVGLTYAPNDSFNVSAYYLGGSDLGLAGTVILNPTERNAQSGLEAGPQPVVARTGAAARQGADRQIDAIRDDTRQRLAQQDIRLLALSLGSQSATVRFENDVYRSEAQGIGRVARVLTATLPPQISVFILEPARNGAPLSAVTVRRADIERLENRANAAALMFERAQVSEANLQLPAVDRLPAETAFDWGISPYIALQLFDGSNPLRGEYGLQADASYAISPNLVIEGQARYSIDGNRQGARVSASTLPPVRRNVANYGPVGSLTLSDLALHWFDRPANEFYSRVSVGYLEKMFAGVSTEVLWKPVDSRLALGAELNYVAQRAYDMGFGLLELDELGGDTYDITTGHLSAYYDFESGFHGRVDVGKYLAGDWGATFTLDREFANGWRIGAYATLTDVPFEEFGEGSFDKGLRISAPVDWALGTATRDSVDLQLASLSRDGGARLNVDGRLYDRIRSGHLVELEEGWGRFWR